jgi:hypothetical protein
MLDTTRAKTAFNFEAYTEFEAGLRETVRWYLAQRAALRTHRPATRPVPAAFDAALTDDDTPEHGPARAA